MRYEVWQSVERRFIDLDAGRCTSDDCDGEHVWVFTERTFADYTAAIRRDMLDEVRNATPLPLDEARRRLTAVPDDDGPGSAA